MSQEPKVEVIAGEPPDELIRDITQAVPRAQDNAFVANFTLRLTELDASNPDSWSPIATVIAPDGGYVGLYGDFKRLVLEQGIIPERASPEGGEVCSIGRSIKDGKWYGWSHRAIHGFQVGDVVREGDCCASSGWTEEYLAEHPEEDRRLPVGFVAKTVDDAKRMAIAFADSVG